MGSAGSTATLDGTGSFSNRKKDRRDEMEHGDIVGMMEALGLPFAYRRFAEGERPEPPYLCFWFEESENFAADDGVYAQFSDWRIALYTDRKDPGVEAAVEAVLEEWVLFWEKEESWVYSEGLYEVLYRVTV